MILRPVVVVGTPGEWEDWTGVRHVSWVVTCPYCGNEHYHGPAQGHRTAPCKEGMWAGGYLLREPAGWRHGVATAERRATCLYRFYRGPELLYVGITGRLPARVREHGREKAWWREVTYCTVDHYDSRHEAEYAERAAIKAERPRYNIAHGIR